MKYARFLVLPAFLLIPSVAFASEESTERKLLLFFLLYGLGLLLTILMLVVIAKRPAAEIKTSEKPLSNKEHGSS